MIVRTKWVRTWRTIVVDNGGGHGEQGGQGGQGEQGHQPLYQNLEKAKITLTGLNSSLPVLLRQPSEVQAQGNPGRSTWWKH